MKPRKPFSKRSRFALVLVIAGLLGIYGYAALRGWADRVDSENRAIASECTESQMFGPWTPFDRVNKSAIQVTVTGMGRRKRVTISGAVASAHDDSIVKDHIQGFCNFNGYEIIWHVTVSPAEVAQRSEEMMKAIEQRRSEAEAARRKDRE